jgi:large-conductance mechanosensitive channel
MAGILEQLGVNGLNTATSTPLNFGKVGLILVCVLIFVIISVVIFVVVWNKSQKKKYNKKIEFAQEINGKVYLTGEDWAKEIKIPNTSVKVFILKERGTFSPKLIYTIGKNRFLILIGKGGEWINTDLRYGADGIIEINDKLKPTRDYANENLKDLIDRNWTNKNKNWFKENAYMIFLIIICALIIIALIINGVQDKKTRASNQAVSDSNLKASQSYAEAQATFIKFLEEHYSDSGVTPATGGG